jgi:hypothetical protein
MNFFNSEKDNIITIVKTLKPIKNIYSKQNKDFDKYFHGLSLKYLVDHMKIQKKYNPYLNPGESLDEPDNNSIMNINFKSTFNYLDELNKVKSLPTIKKISNNIKIIKNKTKGKKNKKILEKKKQDEISNLIRKKMWDENVTLDPGRYYPKYDYIRKKIPCAFIGKPKITEEDYIIQNEEKKEETEKKIKKEKINIQEKKEENDNINNKDIKNANPKNKIILNESDSSKILLDKINSNLDSPKKNNMNNRSNILYPSANKKMKISQKTDKFSSSIIKHQNTASSWSNTLELDSSKKLNEQYKTRDNNRNISLENSSKFNYYSTQKINFKTNKRYSLKNMSMSNLKCPIIFDKMQGRDELDELDKKSKAVYRINYNPDYNALRPHIPTIKFKSVRQYQDFKKYINGKIIRSYWYNPQQYFVFEYKENKENDMNGNYGNIMLNS